MQRIKSTESKGNIFRNNSIITLLRELATLMNAQHSKTISKMRKNFIIIIITAIMPLLCSCRIPKEVLWDMIVIPFSGMDKEQVHEINRFMPDCMWFQFEFDNMYDDSLRRNDYFFLNKLSADRGTYSLLQTRMYDSLGKLARAYDVCMGNAKFLKIYENVPITSKFKQVNRSINPKICLAKDLQFIATTKQEKETLLTQTNQYDYTLVVFWPSTARYYTKRHLREIKRYVKHFGKEYKFRVIYVHLNPAKKN